MCDIETVACEDKSKKTYQPNKQQTPRNKIIRLVTNCNQCPSSKPSPNPTNLTVYSSFPNSCLPSTPQNHAKPYPTACSSLPAASCQNDRNEEQFIDLGRQELPIATLVPPFPTTKKSLAFLGSSSFLVGKPPTLRVQVPPEKGSKTAQNHPF